jgi:hypothetical protein
MNEGKGNEGGLGDRGEGGGGGGTASFSCCLLLLDHLLHFWLLETVVHWEY